MLPSEDGTMVQVVVLDDYVVDVDDNPLTVTIEDDVDQKDMHQAVTTEEDNVTIEDVNDDESDGCADEITDDTHSYNDDDQNEDYEKSVAKLTRAYLLREIRKSRNRINKKIATARLVKNTFGEKLDDEKFFQWLSEYLKFSSADEFRNYLKYADINAPFRGRKTKITKDIAVRIHNFWKENSIITVDRRNDRHDIKISPHKIHKLVRDIEDSNIEQFRNEKGKEKLKGHRHIYTKSLKALYEQFTLETGEEISMSSFYMLRPFYVMPPSIREMESCTCITCVNPHYLYKSYKKVIKKITKKRLPNSLTDFLTQNFQCTKDHGIDYWDIECINSTCKNSCQISLCNTKLQRVILMLNLYQP